MYIMNGAQDQIVNSDYVERFCIVEKPDAALIITSYGAERQPVTLARYKNKEDAHNAIHNLFLALAGGQTHFFMPDSLLYFEETTKKDARVKRRGSS